VPDVVQRLPGLPDWDHLEAVCELYEREGTTIEVMNRRTLIELKRRRATALDLADIEAIEQLDRLDE
jgi:hypothetical protein